ncbi:MAG: hypothetical protein ACR2LX_14355 [Jatrophihabitans sp.]
MGNIGPARQLYEVLPVPAFGVEDADLWRLDTKPLGTKALGTHLPTAPSRDDVVEPAAEDQHRSTR